jgi:hypothetical protein
LKRDHFSPQRNTLLSNPPIFPYAPTYSLFYPYDRNGIGQLSSSTTVRGHASYSSYLLGPGHPSTLDAIGTQQGHLENADDWALAGKEKACGPGHPTVNSLGDLYAKHGHLENAERMFQRALTGFEKIYGPEHSSTVETVNNLRTLYEDQGGFQSAEDESS